jgi:glycosyltransferase involved in cell wall biosynthesis
MKININLQPVNNKGAGIALFANKLIEEIQKQNAFELYGSFNFVRGVKASDLNRFPFPVKYSKVPSKLVYSRWIKKILPFQYHIMMKNKADINLFFTYKIPRVKYKGLVISTIHDLIPLRVSTESAQIEIDYRNDISYTIQHSDFILTISDASKNDILSEFNFDKSKIFVIPNGVDFELYNNKISKIETRRVKVKYKLPDKFIVYLGGIRKHKNVDNLIRAYSFLPFKIRQEISLVITQGNEALKQLAKDLKIEKQVYFTSYIDEEDKPAVYKAALVMAFISSYEGFGLPIIEAMASGTPVITSNVSSMPEVAGNAAVLVNPEQIQEITAALEKIINNQQFRNQIIDLGYENAKKYSWTHSGEVLVKLCNGILNNKL